MKKRKIILLVMLLVLVFLVGAVFGFVATFKNIVIVDLNTLSIFGHAFIYY